MIAHDNPFNREVAGQVGRYFKTSADIRTFVERLNDTDISEVERQASMQRIVSNYTWARVTDAYLDLIKIDL